jgi:NAD(P)-dependent dehydrogenase (short-subunit alcohol dehydrogenase family)
MDDPTAIVAGAAGDIGRATCAALADRGFAVIGWDIAPRPDGVSVVGWRQVDLADGDAPDADIPYLRYVVNVTGGADLGESTVPDLARVPMDVFRRTVGLNLYSAYGVIRATVNAMRATAQTHDCAYTLVSSINAFGGYQLPGYSAGKAALHGLVHALAEPLGRDRIRINAVALGTVHTENAVTLARDAGRDVDYARLGVRMPRGAVLNPDEVATALLSVGVDNPAVSGTVLVADAAQSRRRP